MNNQKGVSRVSTAIHSWYALLLMDTYYYRNNIEHLLINKRHMEIQPIAFFKSPLKTKFGIPKQSGLAQSLQGRIVFVDEWRDAEALRGMEGFDYLWLIWGFSANKHGHTRTTVRPPVLGGNKRMGIWATRSPFRPNNIGLSAVKIERIKTSAAEGPVIYVSGSDLMDGTPIYDIKPYVPYADAFPNARSGFTGPDKIKRLQVLLPDNIEKKLGASLSQMLREVLALDPRPQFHHDASRVYGMAFSGYDIRFKVADNIVEVVDANVSKQ